MTGVQVETPKHGERRVFAINDSVSIAMVWIEPGSFMMGSPRTEKGRREVESPHHVTLSRGFWMGETEISQAQWQAVMNEEFWTHAPWADRDYVNNGPDYPAVYVSWQEVQEFIVRLNAMLDRQFRLPYEAEWEYACRAGSQTPLGLTTKKQTLEDFAWFAGNVEEGNYAAMVGSKQPNAWGLYDMQGNVWEWCQDGFAPFDNTSKTDPIVGFTGNGRVIRGGYFGSQKADCRAASRRSYSPQHSFSGLGFRLVHF